MSNRRVRRSQFVPSPAIEDASGRIGPIRPVELDNIAEMRQEVFARLLAASGYEGPLDALQAGRPQDWFDADGNVKSSRINQLQLLPSDTQLGVAPRVDKSNLQFVDANGDLKPLDWLSEGVDRRDTRTYGVMNHPDFHYTGPQSTGMATLALAGATAISVASLALTGFLSLISPREATLANGLGPLGRAAPQAGEAIGRRIRAGLGFPESQFPLQDCINVGLPLLIGIDLRPATVVESLRGGPQAVQNLAGGLASAVGLGDFSEAPVAPIMESSGFYATMFRGITQDLAVLKNINLRSIGGVRQFIDSVRNLGVIRFLAVAATLGDGVLRQERGVTQPDPEVTAIATRAPYDDYGFRGLKPIDRLGRSRINDGERMSTSLRDLPSAFLPPTTVRAFKNHRSVADKYMPELAGNSESSRRMLNALAAELEQEHLPFWIQDMRTGEVAAFHAFLSSVTDSFSPNLNREETLGRMDPVLSLIRTSRSVSLEFTVVATSADEHDYLWWLVNWLTMLIYPTWSEGITLGDGDTRTSPFGRVPSASPLIRVRLGDILKSNAGTDSLRRLTTSEGKLKEDWTRRLEEATEARRRNAVRARDGEWDLVAGSQYVIFPSTNGYAVKPMSEGERAAALAGGGSSPAQQFGSRLRAVGESVVRSLAGLPSETPPVRFRLYESALFEYKGQDNQGDWGVIFPLGEDGERLEGVQGLEAVYVTRRDLQPFVSEESESRLGDILGGFSALAGARSRLSSANAAQSRIARATESLTASSAEATNLNDIPFVKALRKGALDGLAGMASGLTIDYDWSGDGFALETDHGSKAPMGVKIGLTFEVLHDIQPGRDALGNNRAPIYPVGPSAQDNRGKFIDGEPTPDQGNSSTRSAVGAVAGALGVGGRRR